MISDTKTAIGAIGGIIAITAVASYFGASVETTLVTGAITAIAALATPGASGNKSEE
ncbi:hypothetical protein V7O66_13785 [Methanolobus sp. ZRKC3]|uniref:hypothetical protein n=1 Tax=Methanolobus sp. ZRKC3 TaxID=3125786 RepID=UPI0032435CA2